MKTKILHGALAALIVLAACAERDPPIKAPAADQGSFWSAVWPVLALLETGENPIWFEFASGGPKHIQSPGAASLEPYVPWPHARFSAGIMPWEGFLVMAVNADGFVVLGSAGEAAGAVLYRIAAHQPWDPYTIGSLFLWQNQPAALLYRNDFFADLYAVPPQPQVFALDKSHAVLLGAAVPALERFPPGGRWEAEALRRGLSGYWYYRMREKGTAANRTAYFRARDMEGEGEPISHAQWRSSALPERAQDIPPLLSAILDEAGGDSGFTLGVISAGFDGERVFRSTPASAPPADAPAGSGGQGLRLYAFYREGPEPLAVAVFPDGRGLYAHGAAAGHFSLPALPEKFVYTGIAVLGDIALATWEEQQGAGVGAAGFMARSRFW